MDIDAVTKREPMSRKAKSIAMKIETLTKKVNALILKQNELNSEISQLKRDLIDQNDADAIKSGAPVCPRCKKRSATEKYWTGHTEIKLCWHCKAHGALYSDVSIPGVPFLPYDPKEEKGGKK